MFGIGMTELMIILVVALVVLGPKRLPDVATGLGKAIREFRKATRDIQNQLDMDESVSKPLADIKAALRDEPVPPVVQPLPGLALPAVPPEVAVKPEPPPLAHDAAPPLLDEPLPAAPPALPKAKA